MKSQPAPQTAFPLDSTPSNAAGKVEGAETHQKGWKPISEAPMDWSTVLLYEQDYDDPVYAGFYSMEDGGIGGWVHEAHSSFCERRYPTHFQPLPEPPTL